MTVYSRTNPQSSARTNTPLIYFAESSPESLGRRPPNCCPTRARINTLSVSNAAAHAQNGTGKEALKLVRPYEVGLLLTVIQLYVLTNQLTPAIATLQAFLKRLDHSSNPSDQDIRYAPGAVYIAVSLYTQQSRKSSAKATLAAAAMYWISKRSVTDCGDYNLGTGGRGRQANASLLRTAGTWLVKSSNSADVAVARDIFTDLRDRNSADRMAAAGLVASLAV